MVLPPKIPEPPVRVLPIRNSSGDSSRSAKSAGFTLFEILMVVALSALVMTLGVAPAIRVVRHVVETEKQVGRNESLRMAARRIVGDMQQRSALPEGSNVAFRIVPRAKFGDMKDDVVIFWSAAPLQQGRPVSSVAYGIFRENFLGDFGDLERKKEAYTPPRGLYRWFLPGLLPEEVDPDKLVSSEGQLVLPGVGSFRVEIHDGGTWRNRYEGKIPLGVRIEINYSSSGGAEEKGACLYEDWFPR